MKVHILYDIKDGPFGGGNQFLKALRDEWRDMGVYAAERDEADVYFFNSFPFGEEIRRVREFFAMKSADKILIHRVDGPISEYRGRDLVIDEMIFKLNSVFADGTVFQSKWSEEHNKRLGFPAGKFEKVASNAPNAKVFFPVKEKEKIEGKIKLIATSWSSNMNKGFKLYQYLDEHLDFSKYSMTFVGNSPVQFKNIVALDALDSEGLAEKLREHDVFVTASKKDPCSNSLIEALHCGLPAVVLNDGGHPEIVREGGEVFEGETDVIEKIEKVAANFSEYRGKIKMPSMRMIAHKYYDFGKHIFDEAYKSPSVMKKTKALDFMRVISEIAVWKLRNHWPF